MAFKEDESKTKEVRQRVKNQKSLYDTFYNAYQ